MPMCRRSPKESGFTVIEALIAMAILAVAAIALIGVSQAQVGRINGLETRAIALWIAENTLAEITLSPKAVQVEPENASMLGRDWTVRLAVARTDDHELSSVTITVAEAKSGGPASVLTGFVDMAGVAP